MTELVSISGFFTSSNRQGAKLRRVETPAETPAIGLALEAAALQVFSEEQFIRLAEHAPERLVEVLRSQSLRPALLTFAAEAAGRISNTALAVRALLPLLAHPDPVVREGAVYGLGPHLEGSLEARDALRELLTREPSPGVRTAIQDALFLLD